MSRIDLNSPLAASALAVAEKIYHTYHGGFPRDQKKPTADQVADRINTEAQLIAKMAALLMIETEKALYPDAK